jgi:3-dehydroquinate synthase
LKKIIVNTKSKTYPVFIAENSFSAPEAFLKRFNIKNIAIITDENVFNLYEKDLKKSFKNYNPVILSLPAGEKSKAFNNIKKILQLLKDLNLSKDDSIAAVGGGVIGDAAGFAASIYMRGIKLIHFPTSLLAMVDSSIGGKTAVNFDGVKNLIGTFYQPEFVLTDPNFLKTLPEAEFNSGLGEVVKYAFLSDEKFFNFVNDNYFEIIKNERILHRIIFNCAKIKSEIVSKDEHDKNLRKVLNLGHTFAHGFESALNFKIKHGDAVNAGIISSIILSEKLGIIKKENKERLLFLPLKKGVNKIIGKIDAETAYNFMLSDKKKDGGVLKYVLIKDIGKILIDVPAPKKFAVEAINSLKKFL